MLEVRLVVTAGKQKVALESETAKKTATLPAKKNGGKKRNRKLKYQTQVKESGQAR